MIIEFRNIGTSLGTRAMGREVRESIEAAIRSGEKVVLDFNGVDVVSNSFADESLAKLVLTFDLPFVKQHTTFKNTNPFVQKMIAFAFKERLSKVAH